MLIRRLQTLDVFPFINYFQMKAIVVLAILLLTVVQTQNQNCLIQVPGSLQCQQCANGLQLDDQGNCRLYTPIEGCQIYNSTGAGCFQCQRTYLLSSGVCLAMIPNCESTTNVVSCDICANGFALVRFSKCLSTNVGNCSQGQLPRTVNGIAVCEQYSAINCIVPSLGSAYCMTCMQGYETINGICLRVSSSVPCVGNNCQCQGYYFRDTCYNIQLSNCLSSKDGIYCDLCADNHYISQGFCVQFVKPDDINCNLLTIDGSRCSACNLDYVLDANFFCVKNFRLCPSGCTSCPYNQFNLYQGNCLPQDSLCQVYNFTQQICVLCAEGYFLDPNTRFCAKNETCLSKDQTGRCQSCFSGFQIDLQSFACLKLPPNCLQINTISKICTQCSAFTTLSTVGCIFPTTNCSEYNSYGWCQKCSIGFVEVRRLCEPIASNCQTFGIDQAKCSICNQGFHLFNNLCYLNIEGCLSYSQANSCSRCSQQYQLINGLCIFRDANCLAQDSNGLCLGCNQGFVPSKGRCVYYHPYCLNYDSNTLACTQAAAGFTVGGFSVQQQLAYLNFVIQAESANSNALGSDFVGGPGQGSYSRTGFIYWLPYSGLSHSIITGYSFNGAVSSCQSGFSLVNGQCVRPIQNCQVYEQYGGCQYCNPGYDLVANGTCLLRSSATCLRQQGQACAAGAQGYVAIKGIAIFAGNNGGQRSSSGLLVSAASGYFVWNQFNIAWPLDFNCLSQFIPNDCKSCQVGYSIWNGRCVLLRTNGVAYSSLGVCMGCAQGYLLWAGECRQSNCLSLDSATGFCKTCQSGFTMKLGVCIPASVVNCQVYSGSRCLYCLTGFYVTNNGLCGQMIANCLTASPQTGRCITCVQNYTYYSQQCINSIPHCQAYTASLTSCATCDQLYYPVNLGSICGYLGTNCLILVNQFDCGQCKPGFNLITQNNVKMCVRSINNCNWYDAKANCLICNPGYVLQFNSCKSMRCDQFFPPRGQCTTCYSPFILKNGYCTDPNCRNQTQEICLSCLPLFYLKNGLCTRNGDPNCGQVANNGTCLKCLPGFVLNINGLCQTDVIIYNGCVRQEFPCTNCLTGYDLINGLCWARKCRVHLPNRDCQICINYYNLEPTQRFCILYTCASPSCYLNDGPPHGFNYNGTYLNISYCLAYNGANCVSCSNFRFSNPATLYGLCFPHNCRVQTLLDCSGSCLALFSNNITYPGTCLADNCLNHATNGQCLGCITNFTLKAGTCVLIQIDGCQIIDYANQRCQVCMTYYDIWNGRCRPSNCSTYANDGITCLKCNNGFIFAGRRICQPGKCINIIWPICQQCSAGYQLAGGLCTATNCQVFDEVALVCIQCSQYFQVAPNIGICRPSNCASYDSNLLCAQCNQGYTLRNGVCIQGNINCTAFFPNGNCQTCKNNMVPVGPECVTQVPGCLDYTTFGCSICKVPYTLNNGLCQVKYCQRYASPDFCQTCKDRYRTQPDGTCIPLNCLSFNRNTWECSTCEARFQLVVPLCFTYNCSVYNVSTYVCDRCQRGFILQDQTCVFSNCVNPTQRFCPTCLPGFNLINGLCHAPQTNCVNYDQNILVCLQCAQGYKVNPFGLCIFIFEDPFCQQVDSQSQRCTRCFPSFSYNPSSQQCQSNYCFRFNSTQPQLGRICTSCQPGFMLDPTSRYCLSVYCSRYTLASGQCDGCIMGTSLRNNICFPNNCQAYNSNNAASPICQTCNQGYQLNNQNLCVVINCATFNLNLTCNRCNSGYDLQPSGICTSVTCPPGFFFKNSGCFPINCQTYNSGSQGCQVCLPGFIPQNNACIAQSCIQYDSSYKCVQCRQGYNLRVVNGQTLCILTSPPTCSSGYYFKDNNCIVIPVSNCSVSDPTGQICYNCLSGFLLRGNVCYWIQGCIWPSFISGCTNCISGYFLDGFLCISLNCRQINQNNNTCKTCFDGYSLVRGVCQRMIYKCLNLDANGNCLKCVDMFQLINGRCIAIGCRTYNPSTFVCLQCQPNYFLDQIQQICNIQLPNCFRALNATYCQQCDNGFVQLVGKCYPQIPGCLRYSEFNGLCTMCQQGYYVNQQGQCINLPPFCSSARSDGNCLDCIQGYRLTSGQCSPIVDNCQAFDPSTGVCTRCISNYYLTFRNQCQPLPIFCRQADPSGVCRSCISNYYLTAGGQCQRLPDFCTGADPSGACTGCYTQYTVVAGKCVRDIPFCDIYNQNNPTECFQCFRNYYLNANYGCSLLPPFCLNANSLGVCIICDSSHKLVNSLCVIPTPNCISYVQTNTITRCSQCQTGYSLTPSYQCSTQLPPNCLKGSAGICTQCVSGYTIFRGFCVFDTANCVAWNQGTLQCSSCDSGFYLLIQGNNYSCRTLPPYCLSADVFGNCLSCIPNYIIYNRKCVDRTSILNCQQYDVNTFVCQRCLPGFVLNSNKRCLPQNCRTTDSQGRCTSCLPNFNLVNGLCTINIAFCIQYSPVNGICLRCANGYEVGANGLVCTNGDPNCLSFSNGQCTRCVAGYFLRDRCIQLPPGCNSIGINLLCDNCINGFVLVSGSCVREVQFCAVYSTNGCRICHNDYYLQNNICKAYPEGCLQFDPSANRCLRCATGYQLQSSTGTCRRGSNICVSYNNNNQCIYCAPRYYLKAGNCFAYPAYCITVDLLGNCLSCAFGSRLINGICQATTDRNKNCLNFDSSKMVCLVCVDGYVLCPATGVCLRKDPGCQRFGVDGNCQECTNPYLLYEGVCALYPPGVIVLPNGGIGCRKGYTLSNNSCLKTQSTLIPTSTLNNCQFGASSGNTASSFIGSNAFWSPSSLRINEYLSMTFVENRAQVIFQVGVRGSNRGWVSGYVLYYKNSAESPFICWNGCNMVVANSDGSSTSWLKLYHPIVATQIRIYPVRWVGELSLQTDLSLLTFN